MSHRYPLAVGVWAIVLDREGRQVLRLTDPAGGSFDAAGDFDRLLYLEPGAVTWSSIDPYGVTTLDHEQAAALLEELPAVAKRAHGGPERRGMARLAQLAALCGSGDAISLRFIGD